MKIGILTVPFNNNYGGLLQAYALKSTLVKLGHEVVFINRRRSEPRTLKYKVYKMLVKLKVIDDYLERKLLAISKNTEAFKIKYLEPITEPYYSESDLKKCLQLGIDFFIVGSDQVWRYSYAGDTITDYFFGFLKGLSYPRMSYAASFGIDKLDYPADYRKVVSELLSSFSGISVREESGLNILEQLGIERWAANLVLDPTMLISVIQYKLLFNDAVSPSCKYMFTYILDDSVVNDCATNSFCRDLQLKRLDMRAQTGNFSKQCVVAPVEDWLKGISESEGVLTDSFHGTVFSIIFNKPFLVVANPNRGISRLQSLLDTFGLSNRLILSVKEFTKERLYATVDWCSVNDKISVLRKASTKFLVDVLK